MSRVFPFSNGEEYRAWVGVNCDECSKAGDYHETGFSPCPILDAVLESMNGEGVTRAIARRMGYPMPYRPVLGFACTEKSPHAK